MSISTVTYHFFQHYIEKYAREEITLSKTSSGIERLGEVHPDSDGAHRFSEQVDVSTSDERASSTLEACRPSITM